MKIAIVADIHFGVKGRLQDILWSCRVIREYCKVAKIDTIIILGDLFHDRQALEIDTLCSAIEFFEETSTTYNQEWVVFPGNHDMFLRHSWEINSLLPLKKHLTVLSDAKILKINDRRLWVLPFIQYEKSYMKVLSRINSNHEEGDILLTHIGVRGATLNTCFLLKDWSSVTFDYSNFSTVYTGHFHSNQVLNDKVYYPGSPIPFKFDEGDISHGFYVHDLANDDKKFINIWKAGKRLLPNEKPAPQYSTISDLELEGKSQETIENHLLRISLTRDYTTNDKKAIKEKLMQLGACDVKWVNIAQRPDNLEKMAIRPEHRNFFETWIELDKDNLKDLDLKLLHKVNDDVVQDGDNLYSVENTNDVL